MELHSAQVGSQVTPKPRACDPKWGAERTAAGPDPRATADRVLGPPLLSTAEQGTHLNAGAWQSSQEGLQTASQCVWVRV